MKSLNKPKKKLNSISQEKILSVAKAQGFSDIEGFLRHCYIDKKLPIHRIAYMCDTSDTTIGKILKVLGIPRRKNCNNKLAWQRGFGAIFERPQFTQKSEG
jgi:hypothetical protein